MRYPKYRKCILLHVYKSVFNVWNHFIFFSFSSALNCYISSLQYGESAQDKKWTDEMFQKFSNLISELSSEKQAVFIFGIHQKICHSGYDKLACEIMLQYGEDMLPQALEFFGKYIPT